MKKILLPILLIILTGCAATGPSYEAVKSDIDTVKPDMARVIFFRTKESSLYIARKAPIDINGEKTGACSYGGFFYRDLPAGTHSIKTEIWDMPGECELILKAEAGNKYYFKVDPRSESFAAFMLGGVIGNAIESSGKSCGGAFKLYPASEEIAQEKISVLKMSD